MDTKAISFVVHDKNTAHDKDRDRQSETPLSPVTSLDLWLETEGMVHILEQKGLSRREVDVLTWVARGKTNSVIGMILHISPRTVSKHLEHIYSKLGVECRTAAVVQLLEIMQDSQYHAEEREVRLTSRTEKGRVLLVDDDRQNRFMVRSALEDQGYQCQEVNNGKAALAFLSADTVDLVITDNRMPLLSGLQFLQELSKNQSKALPPIIMYTGNVTRDLKEQACNAGVFALIPKPCPNKEFLAIVDQALQQTHPGSKMQNAI